MTRYLWEKGKIKKSLLIALLIVGCLYADDKIANNKNKSIQLIFVYNAKSGFINGVFDYIHKFVSPQTYSCNLCAITYDNTGKKNEWRKYLNSLPMEVIFAYKNNLYKEKLSLEYHGEGLPCAFLLVEGKQTYFLTSDEINNISNLDELIRLVDNKLSNINN